MSDTISRQAAIDALCAVCGKACDKSKFVYNAPQDEQVILCPEHYCLCTLPSAQPEINCSEIPNSSDCISRQAAIDALDEIEAEVADGYGYQYTKWREYFVEMPPAEPEIIRCKDCKCWVPGYITDNDDFIPPKCGKWQQMVGHSSDDYCSLAERREVTT